MDFEMLGLTPRLIARLKEQGITDPTPIQAQAIPHAMNGRDMMGLAQTGTGKTLAFGVPLIHALTKIGRKPAPKTVAGLILAPTRELAKQISDNLRAYTKGSHLKVAMVVGGQSLNRQVETMARGIDLLVATPGRLIDLIDAAPSIWARPVSWCWTRLTRCWTWALSTRCAGSRPCWRQTARPCCFPPRCQSRWPRSRPPI